ncbi:DUF4142 domain-containing protein [Chitinophaga sp. 22321]|uniref:DUF4142 domain-containing protein n=1 Tax=Chitinophaga hostae TaxID=2831022 RepID=A0ABS5J680_9BACT|nr:DUF4142 domain-containing protein [Chitinophaga hostae]MBS0030725.1 DUF4142 domain-containing protein [Chitinophaga hostae]
MKKSISFFYCSLTFIFLFFSCNSGSPDSEKRAKKINNARIDSLKKQAAGPTEAIPSKGDAAFLVEAAGGGLMEVALGELAVENSRNTHVKNLGTLMANDHKTINEKIKLLALSKDITLPDSISAHHKKEKEQLQPKKGSDFDNAYINLMVDDHEKDIREFQNAAKNALDSDIKAFAAESLPMLYKHLDVARNLQRKMGTKVVPIPVGSPPYQ